MPRTLISVRGQEFYLISQLVDVGDEPVPDSAGIDERAGDVTKIIDVFDDGWPGARELNRGVASLPVGGARPALPAASRNSPSNLPTVVDAGGAGEAAPGTSSVTNWPFVHRETVRHGAFSLGSGSLNSPTTWSRSLRVPGFRAAALRSVDRRVNAVLQQKPME